MKSLRSKLRLKTLVLVGVLTLILAGCSHGASSGGSQDSQVGGEKSLQIVIEGRFEKGKLAPRIVTTSFSGEKVDISQWYGEKAVVLDFWAGWCPFCVGEMSELQKTQDAYSDDLVMIGVHRTDTEPVKTGEKFAKERGVSYLLVKDDGSIYRAAGGLGMPVAVFINKEGVVEEVKSGPKTAEEIAEKVGKLINFSGL